MSNDRAGIDLLEERISALESEYASRLERITALEATITEHDHMLGLWRNNLDETAK